MFQRVENNGSMSWNEKVEGYGGLCLREKVQINQSNDDGFDYQSSEEVNSAKRIKLSPKFDQQIFQVGDIDASEESSPLGLTLTKTPSFMNQIDQMKLFQERQRGYHTEANHGSDHTKSISKMDAFVSQSIYEKLKATNFPATLIKIGNWEKISKNEGHLVAKCYYAKRKLVWEILEGALKSKIELQWSDIVAIRAIIRDNAPGVLEIELNQPPLFFRETNPQPRKHTLWQPASDFTGGILDKHYEKLIQCDQRLCLLSQKPFPSQESPYFESDAYVFPQFSFNGYGPQYLHGLQYPHRIHHIPLIPSHVQSFKRATQHHGRIMDTGSPMSVMDFAHMNETSINNAFSHHKSALWDQGPNCVANVAKKNYVQGLPSITSETQANLLVQNQDYHVLNYVEKAERPNLDTIILDDIENHLLGDSQVVCSDEKKLLAKVQSMYSLLEPLEEVNLNKNSCRNQLEYRCEIQESKEILDGGVPYPEPIEWLPSQSSMEVQWCNHQ